MTSVVQTVPVLAGQKRKRANTLVVYCSADELSSDVQDAKADVTVEYAPSTGSRSPSPLGKCKVKKYQCSYEGCDKAYMKPSRLEEHVRSHTGQRPFVCPACSKSYLRESHLSAHARTHMDATEKKFLCEADGCGKAFWTAQHLKVHTQMHQGVKPFSCTTADCTASFAKHHQLRAHVAEVHCPPGTKPFRCEHAACDKSFATNQKLSAHAKTHEEKRYACVHPSCRTAMPFFSKWTALQRHIREVHPPTCPRAECARTFASHANLRAHLTLHDQRAADSALAYGSDEEEEMDEDEDKVPGEPPRKRMRRGGELGREWKCTMDDCEKAFKSKRALTVHTKVNHLGARDFICDVPRCGKAFGYKHLLQRHTLSAHTQAQASSTEDDGESSSASASADPAQPEPVSTIDFITGRLYMAQKRSAPGGHALVSCPYPTHFCSKTTDASNLPACRFVFSRAYDLRRHLRAEHDEEWEKEEVDAWVHVQKKKLCAEAPPASTAH